MFSTKYIPNNPNNPDKPNNPNIPSMETSPRARTHANAGWIAPDFGGNKGVKGLLWLQNS